MTGSQEIPWPGAPWRCGHSELVRGCECGDAVAAWWADTLRKVAGSHGRTVLQYFGDDDVVRPDSEAAA